MTYQKARHLLEAGKRSCIYRRAWHKHDPTACLMWTPEEEGESTGRGWAHFSACGDWLYKTGSWSGTPEDHNAEDWTGTIPEKA